MMKAAGSPSPFAGTIKMLRRVFGIRRRVAQLALTMSGVTPILAGRPANAYPYSSVEMWRLYKDIRQRQPQTVMEFGVGCSTLVIAAALHKNRRGRLITVDASEEWLAVCRDTLPPHLVPFVDFNFSPVEKIENQKAHRYSRLPRATLDYLFIDGPSVMHISDWKGPPIAGDPAFSDMKFNKGARITVEGRGENVEFLKRHLGSSWQVKSHPPLLWVTFDS